MNIFTHLAISSAILDFVDNNTDVRLDRKAFKYGSIKPDIDHRLSSVPHYKDYVMDYLVTEIKSLLNMKINSNCTEVFSEKLGLITHYLSDFFCFAHSEYFRGSILAHYFYEFRLSVYCRRNKIKVDENLIYRLFNIGSDYISICRNIEGMQKDYLKAGSRFALTRDIWYTMEMTISFCISAINTCLINEMQNDIAGIKIRSHLESA
jgi:hypothetical protein